MSAHKRTRRAAPRTAPEARVKMLADLRRLAHDLAGDEGRVMFDVNDASPALLDAAASMPGAVRRTARWEGSEWDTVEVDGLSLSSSHRRVAETAS